MSSRLETVPRDILQHIAFLSTPSSVFDPPIEIRKLLLTSSCLYQSINVHAAPMYSNLITQSHLAEEISNRCRLLRRARLTNLSSLYLTPDLLTALWLIVESDGLNEQQLINSNFSAFILRLAYDKLQYSQTPDRWLDQHIIVLLLSLALPRGTIVDMSMEERDELYGLIYPFISMSSRNSQSLFADRSYLNGCSFPSLFNSAWHASGPPTYLGHPIIKIPDPSFAAIYLAFVIYEMRQLKLPYHLPESCVIANATQHTGPTKDDYKSMSGYKTALFADCLRSTDEHTSLDIICDHRRSMNHDLEFGILLQISTYIRRLTSTNTATEMSFMKAMQCSLTEYISVSSDEEPTRNTTITLGYRRYQKYVTTASGNNNINSNCTDGVIVLGQTLDGHDQAWGAYSFTGRMHKDGLLVLKRQAKAVRSREGTWFFKIRLHVGSVIVGRWWIS